MGTTSLLAETLIVGLQTGLWLVLLVAVAFGVPNVGDSLKGWESLVGLYVVAAAYTLGVLFDRLAAFGLRPAENWFWRWVQGHPHGLIDLPASGPLPRVDDLRMQLKTGYESIAEETDDIRRQLRVARATWVNLLALSIILGIALAMGRPPLVSGNVTGKLEAFSVVFLVLAFASYIAIEIQYYRRLVAGYNAKPGGATRGAAE